MPVSCLLVVAAESWFVWHWCGGGRVCLLLVHMEPQAYQAVDQQSWILYVSICQPVHAVHITRAALRIRHDS